MADEAFALSPISARAAQPSEEDYDAISQAFMETSRGRWFLGEYAKRNRNADTRMVLDAVARIEDSLAAQRQPQPAPDNGLAEALAAIRNAVDEARGASAAALDGLALEDKLAPVRKGARIIREISWRWREIGADGRICDLLDSQVAAIEGACGQIASIDPRTELSAAFDLIAERIAELGDDDTATAPTATAPTVEAAAPSSAPAPTAEMSAAAEVAMAEDIVEAAMTSPAAQLDEVAETAVATVEAEVITDEAADAHDDAILDMIALEMAAEDPCDADDALEMDAGETHVAELAPADPIVVAEEPEPIAAAAAEPQAVELPLQASPEASAEPEPSLGSTLIASGILQRPKMTACDPFAPIRRMSQAEKIAFFS
ncbi:hypothetical protein KMZ29_10035 [Bradyrhizobium sediminis]|uniref:Chemotaxis protein CheZ n=1 Tax=Bradyrhizobium sediminis TaxID=2840469 RepID=A0A975NIZ3_9BRAD|nr:hypothetical protein [Bradyrhizobium sediminis]QWG14959.1 hypothetical protein KMZ29_10035 [Bradyrhizobium sediminis]